jgi:hypothetical protein
MALALGTNVGFVATAPSTDPAGGDTTIDGSSVVVKDTSPSTAVKITQIGWYRGSGTNTANFEIALYSDSAGVADARLYVDNTNSSSSSGWITVTVDWAISPSTAYWLGLQMDAHTGSSTVDSATSGGSGTDVRTSQTTLNDPYGGGTVADADGMYAIYALYQTAPTVTLNSPADASSDSDTTPTFDFTGTDAQSNDIRYNVQIAASNFTQITRTTLTNGNANGTLTTVDTESVSPSANKLQLLSFSVRNGSNITPTISSVTGCGLTWELVDSVAFDTSASSLRKLFVYKALGASPSSGAITIDLGGTDTDVTWSLEEFTGMDTTTPIITTNIATNKDETLSASSLTVTLPNAFGNVNNAVFGVFGTGNDTDGHVAGSGFTIAGNSPGAGVNGLSTTTEFRNDNDTSVDMTFTSGVQFGGIAIEIKAATQIISDKVSGTDSGFANPDNGGDTDPFTSGENIQFTVQAGDALAVGTYYWRARGIDPTGSNSYGAWSSARSFDITAGGGTLVKDIISGFIPFAR